MSDSVSTDSRGPSVVCHSPSVVLASPSQTMAARTAEAGAAGTSSPGSTPQTVNLSSLSLQQLVGVKDQLDAVSAVAGFVERNVYA